MSWLVREGEIGAAALTDLVGLPFWLTVGVETGAIVAVVGIELISGAISGADRRAKLREAIHSAIQPRINAKKAAMINDMLKNKLKTILESLSSLGYTKEQVDKAQKDVFHIFKEEVHQITDQKAKAELAALDKNRGSWTNEDK